MKSYWDASALVETHVDGGLHAKLKSERAFTRTHSLSEIFSTLTGGLMGLRSDATAAAKTIEDMSQYLDFVDLTAAEIVKALGHAQRVGVRGGRVHDYLHALAAQKSGAKTLLTLDKNDFNGLVTGLAIEQV